MKLSQALPAVDQVKAFDIPLSDEEGAPRIKGEWSPGKLTGNTIQTLTEEQTARNVAVALVEVLHRWDLTYDDDTPIPLEVDAVMALPMVLVAELLSRLQASVAPSGEANGSFAGG